MIAIKEFIINDYAPDVETLSEEECEDSSIEQTEEKPHNPLEYFDEITSLGKCDARLELIEAACPVPFDFFKGKIDELYFFSVLGFDIANEFHLEVTDIAVRANNVECVKKFLAEGNPMAIRPNTIPSGIIAATREYLVLVGSPNRDGFPGRLFIIYSNWNSKKKPIPNQMSNHTNKAPIEYKDTVRDIKKYGASLLDRTLDNIRELRPRSAPCELRPHVSACELRPHDPPK